MVFQCSGFRALTKFIWLTSFFLNDPQITSPMKIIHYTVLKASKIIKININTYIISMIIGYKYYTQCYAVNNRPYHFHPFHIDVMHLF